MKMEVLDRLIEIPYRLRPGTRSEFSTWPLTSLERVRVVVTWPSHYQWALAEGITETLRAGLARTVALRVENTPQHHKGVIMLGCRVDDRSSLVALDYSDYEDHINEQALAECSLYIKLQFREHGYPDRRIIRGGYPVTGLDYYRYYRAFRAQYAGNRRIGVLGRFGYRYQGEVRQKAVKLLGAASDINFVGAGSKVRYSRFLRESASARLSLHLPGNGPFTHRVAEFLGLGTCMISPRFVTELNVQLEAGVHYVSIADDMSDLLEACRYYLAHDDEREKIAKAGQEVFDHYLHCDHLGAYYVRSILDRPGAP